MNRFQVAALVAVLVGVAIASLVLGLRSARPSLAQVRRILGAGRALAPVEGHRSDRSRAVGGTRRLADELGGGGVGTWIDQRIGDGLALVDMSVTDVLSRVLLGLAVGGTVPTLAIGAALATGALPASPLWFVVVPVVAVAAGSSMWHDVVGRIERRRRALRRASNDFIQLVAVGLTTDQSVDEAVQFALGVTDSSASDLLRRGLLSAPQRGISLWDALDQLGRTYQQRELCELGACIERQGLHGVSISQTVSSLATSMRAKALDELERDADRANANLSGPTIGFVVATIVFLAFPLATRINEAFGR